MSINVTIDDDDFFATIVSEDGQVIGQVETGGGTTVVDISSLSQIPDVDTTNIRNGSVLVYKTSTNKWTSTINLDMQNLEGGEF